MLTQWRPRLVLVPIDPRRMCRGRPARSARTGTVTHTRPPDQLAMLLPRPACRGLASRPGAAPRGLSERRVRGEAMPRQCRAAARGGRSARQPHVAAVGVGFSPREPVGLDRALILCPPLSPAGETSHGFRTCRSRKTCVSSPRSGQVLSIKEKRDHSPDACYGEQALEQANKGVTGTCAPELES